MATQLYIISIKLNAEQCFLNLPPTLLQLKFLILPLSPVLCDATKQMLVFLAVFLCCLSLYVGLSLSLCQSVCLSISLFLSPSLSLSPPLFLSRDKSFLRCFSCFLFITMPKTRLLKGCRGFDGRGSSCFSIF